MSLVTVSRTKTKNYENLNFNNQTTMEGGNISLQVHVYRYPFVIIPRVLLLLSAQVQPQNTAGRYGYAINNMHYTCSVLLHYIGHSFATF